VRIALDAGLRQVDDIDAAGLAPIAALAAQFAW